MKVLCCGDREWERPDIILRELRQFPPGTVIIHGKARGADDQAGMAAHIVGFDVVGIDAEWDRYGKAAGPIRNRAMLDLHPDVQLVLAFHNHIERSKGTADMIAVARQRNIVVRLVTHTDATLFLPEPKLF